MEIRRSRGSRSSLQSLNPLRKFTLHERVQSRLASLPPTPKIITTPTYQTCQLPSTPTTKVKNLIPIKLSASRPVVELPSIPATEVSESTSTEVTNSTTGTVDENQDLTTAAVSAPQIFVIQKWHVSPEMPIDTEKRTIWDRQIRPRLSAVLLQSIPSGTCVQEFMMAGRQSSCMKPAVIVSCGDAVTKKRVEKTFKKQAWLQDILRTHRITFVALVSQTTFSAASASQQSDAETLKSFHMVKLVQSNSKTLCGQRLLIYGPNGQLWRYGTLGGLLTVNGQAYGLTVGHLFSQQRNGGRSRQNEVDTATSLSESLSDDDASSISCAPFVWDNEDDEPANETLSTSAEVQPNIFDGSLDLTEGQPQVHESAESALQLEFLQPHCVLHSVFLPRHISQETRSIGSHDWALLELHSSRQSLHANIVTSDGNAPDMLIESIELGTASGNALIIVADEAPRVGYIHPSTATIQRDQLSLDVQLITLEQNLREFLHFSHGLIWIIADSGPLARGSSGAWVVQGNKLCGHIVASRPDLPWAYMVPIGPVVNDIKAKFNTSEVRFLTHAEQPEQASNDRIDSDRGKRVQFDLEKAAADNQARADNLNERETNEDENDPNIVSWNSKENRRNPINWTKSEKVQTILALS
jgi:hypothetical protein